MDDKKLLLLANKLQSRVGGKSMESNFESFQKLVKSQREYFDKIGPADTFQLFFFIYGIKRGMSEQKIRSIINNLEFLNYFVLTGEKADDTCDYCEGDGRIECEYCNGNGYETCDQCSGEGEVECNNCEGEGTILDDEGDEVQCDQCDGSGMEECGECGGESTVPCKECNGSGNEECSHCEGQGEIETNRDKFDQYLIATWNRDLVRIATDSIELEKSPFEVFEMEERFGDEYLTLKHKESSYEFEQTPLEDTVYFYFKSDEPVLRFNVTDKWIFDDYENLEDHI